jgi:hypothetical protein
MYFHDTYDHRVQLGAARRRWEDAEALHNAGRWAGAIYMAGYAIECALCASICFQEGKNNFKDTRVFIKKGMQGATLHDLTKLLQELPMLQKAIKYGYNGKYQNAWNTITTFWQKDKLRYYNKIGNEDDSKRFIDAVRMIYGIILSHRGESL